MRVAPSSYYAARARPLSARSVRDEALTDVIRRVWEENYCVFGVRKMHAFLNTHELGVGYVARCTVERLMRRMGIRGVSRRRTRHVTASAPRHACPLDLVNRHFGAHDLNELWVADITYVPTQAGWVYVSFVTDVCSRKRACQFFCVWGLEVGGDSVGVGGGELGEGLFPVGGGVSLDEACVSCSFVGGFPGICEALGRSFVFDVADG